MLLYDYLNIFNSIICSKNYILVLGGVPEWLNGAVSKTVDLLNGIQGFESLCLRANLLRRSIKTFYLKY